MKVRMRTSSAGPTGSVDAGQIAEVSDEEAAELIERGFAEAIDTPSESGEEPSSVEDEPVEDEPVEEPKPRRQRGARE